MMEELLPGVFVHTSHIQKLQSVVLVKQDAVYVFDPCYFPDEIDEICSFARRFEEPGRAKHLILTHSDFDHIAGVHAFADYKVIVSNHWDEANEVASIAKIEKFDSEFYVDRDWVGKMPRVQMDYKMNHGQEVGQMTFYHAQGHTSDGLVTIIGQTAIVGDYLSAVEFPFVYTSYRDYIATLSMFREIFKKHKIHTVITQHGPAARNQSEIERRLALSEEYLGRALEFVSERIKQKMPVTGIVSSAVDFIYDGQPIAIGIRTFHTSNLKLIYQELLAESALL